MSCAASLNTRSKMHSKLQATVGAHTHTSLIGPLRLWLFPSRWRSAPVGAHTQDFVNIEQWTRAAKQECRSKVHIHLRSFRAAPYFKSYFTEDRTLSAPVPHPTTPQPNPRLPHLESELFHIDVHVSQNVDLVQDNTDLGKCDREITVRTNSSQSPWRSNEPFEK